MEYSIIAIYTSNERNEGASLGTSCAQHLYKKFWLDTDIHPGSSLRTFPFHSAGRAFMGVTLDQHYGRKIFWFCCRAASRSPVFFFCRSISFCGSSCPSIFKDLAIAASIVHSAVSKTCQAQKSSGI
jgi:hypothetical protein